MARLAGSGRKRPAEGDGHEALFSSVTIHFTMTVHGPSGLALERASRRLLRGNLAGAAAWPSEKAVRLTPGIKSLARKLDSGERLASDVEMMRTTGGVRGFASFAARHPRFALGALIRTTKRSQTTEDDGGADEARQIMDDSLDLAHDVIMDAQKVALVERHIDAVLFGGKARNDDDFVRLTLRNSYNDVLLPGTSETFYFVAEPRLMLHRSGIGQLTIAVPVKQPVTTSELVVLARSDRVAIKRSQMGEPLLADLPARGRAGVLTEVIDVGARLHEFDFATPLTMAELLERYLAASGSFMKVKLLSEWLTYATVIATPGDCCPDAPTWRRRHQSDLARVAARYESADPIEDPAAMLGPDLRVGGSDSLFANMASAVLINYDQPVPPLGQLDTVLIVEHALLQYTQLRRLELAVLNFETSPHSLETLYRSAIAAFASMRQSDIRWGSARDISRFILDEMGGTEMRQTIESALDMAGRAGSAKAASTQARRSLRLAWLATVLAALTSIAPIQLLLQSVSTKNLIEPFATLAIPLAAARDLGAWGPWAIVGVICVSLLAVIGWHRATRHRYEIPRRLKPRGWKWSKPIEVRTEPLSQQDGAGSDGPDATVDRSSSTDKEPSPD